MLKKHFLLIVLTLSILTTKAQIGSNAFALKVDLAAASPDISNGCIADFNGDGKNDIAAVSASSSSNGILSVYINQVTGSIINSSSFSRRDFFAGGNTTSINCGDIDGDGRPDIVSARSAITGPSSFSVFGNTSSGSTIGFSQRNYTLPSDMFAPYLHDIDGDGKKDLVGCMWAASQLRVYLNTSTAGYPNFDSVNFFSVGTGSNPGPLTCADFDGDGKTDVAILSVATNTLRIFRNTSTVGSISFASALQLTTSSNPVRISSGDLDNDGKTDIVTCSSIGPGFQLFKNASAVGTVAFDAGITYSLGSSTTHPLQPQCADFDSDGKLDLVVGRNSQNSLSVYKNFTASGGLNASSLNNKKDFTVGSTSEVYTGDLNNDGSPDIVSINRGSGTISILRNQIVPSNGLVAHYPFSGNAGDSSGYENHGSVSGPVLTADRFNNPNKAYYFNGNTDIITVPANISLRPDKVSMLAWVKSEPKAGTSWNTIVCYRYQHTTTPFNSYSITTNPAAPYGNKWTLVAANSTTQQSELINKNVKTDNVWMHIAAVVDGSSMKIYVNGILDTSHAFNIPAIQYSSMGLYLGNDRPGFPDAFLGAIDDIKIYNRPLSAAEILEQYTGNAGKVYYTKSSGAINLLSSWGTNPDGSGTSPLSFDSANTTYIVTNNNSPVLGGSLKIGGAGSVLKIGNGSTAFTLSIAAGDTLSCDSVYINSNITITASGTLATKKLASAAPSSVQYLSTSMQTLAAGLYDDLVVYGSQKSLSGNTVVGSDLGMASSIHTNGFLLTLGTGTVNKGALNHMQGTIIGKFTRWFDNTANTAPILFPVGISSKSAPFQVQFTSAPSSGGIVTAEFVSSNPGTTGLPVLDMNGFVFIDKTSIEGYWKVSSNIGSGTFTAYAAANNFAGVNDYTRLRLLKRATGGSWSIPSGSVSNSTGSNASVVVNRSGLSGLEAEYTIGGDQSENPLPVKLLSFTAQNLGSHEALLRWTTASEFNAEKFVIERSSDKRTWQTRAEAKASGNSSTSLNYNTIDNISGESGSLYYRLVQYDFDGNFHTSSIIELNLDAPGKAIALQVYPNPGSEQITIEGLTSQAILFNSIGTALQTVSAGVLNIRELPAGLYYIRTGTQTVKFIKQ